jgi:anti-sigma factor RsiW
VSPRPTVPSGPCPELEQLAALADGQLPAAERDAVLSHLGTCTNCYELFVEIRRSLDELDGAATTPLGSVQEPTTGGPPVAGPANPPRPFPSRQTSAWRSLALAAGLMVAVAAVYTYWQRAPHAAAPSLDRAALVAALPPAPALSISLWGGVVERGELPDRPLARDSAEIGALMLDLDLALAAADGPRAAAIARRLSTLLAAAGLLADDATALAELASDPQRLFADDRRQQQLDALDARLRQRFLPFYLDLGAFAEAARLAAQGAAPQLLGDQRTRDYVTWLLVQDTEPLTALRRDALSVLTTDPSPQARTAAAERLLDDLTR